MAEHKFRLGRIVATQGALAALREARQDADHFIALHASGAWGDLQKADKCANDAAIAYEGDPERQFRVLSSYSTRTNKIIWIITEADRSVTTLLLPEEY